MKQLSARDTRILIALPALFVAILYLGFWWNPGADETERLNQRLKDAGMTPEAWTAPLAEATRAVAEAEQALAEMRQRFESRKQELARELGEAGSGSHRSQPSALETLNAAAQGSGAALLAAHSQGGAGNAGVWSVSFLAGYAAMTKCLTELANEPGVVVRRIDRIPAQDAAAQPVWKLLVEM